jgi:hypothetical protein
VASKEGVTAGWRFNHKASKDLQVMDYTKGTKNVFEKEDKEKTTKLCESLWYSLCEI